MRKVYLALFLVIIGNGFGSVTGFGQTNSKSEIKSEPKSALLYRIEGNGLTKPSYLFGTIHLICEKDMFEAATMKSFIDQTEQLMLELNMSDQDVMTKVMAGSVLKDGKTAKALMKPEDYSKLDAAFKAYLGISFDVVAAYKPIVSSSMFLISPKIIGCQAPTGYETKLTAIATAKKLPIISLETADEQIAVLDSQSVNEQIKWLTDIANDPKKPIDEFQKLGKLYFSQDSDALFEFSSAGMKASGLSQVMMLDDRNIKWLPAIETTIKAKPTFIAVGAAHLGGANGVVSLMRAKGYKLTPIRL
ncbi:MAG TPA: TraB/GumN family protein [Pyrinomonadaceae bacterium]|nr:TraB/GumN family protein [Pyrinomonadaceae bacterium]